MGNDFCCSSADKSNSQDLPKSYKLILKPHDSSNTFLRDFKKVKLLGQGGYGKVYLVEHNSGNKARYAMKVQLKPKIEKEEQIQRMLQERHILGSTESQYLVKLHFAFQSPTKIYLLMDYMNGGDLQQILDNRKLITEYEIAFYTAEILYGLDSLHSQKIIYRDLKPSNILLTSDGHIKLADFGLAKMIQINHKAHSIIGTEKYIAPEVILQKSGYTQMCDYYSLGCLVHHMAVGMTPFGEKEFTEMIIARQNTQLNLPLNLSDELKQLLQGLLKPNPKKRAGNKGPNEILSLPFFKQIDLELLKTRQLEAPFRQQPLTENLANSDVKFHEQPSLEFSQNKYKFEGFTYQEKRYNFILFVAHFDKYIML